ncbi:hypothetical protein P8452_33582 [Trifolium repens]|nr:hypothetical protein P8452_33582 [Trifolium repens]
MDEVSVPLSLHTKAISVPVFNGLNFSEWKEQVEFHLDNGLDQCTFYLHLILSIHKLSRLITLKFKQE